MKGPGRKSGKLSGEAVGTGQRSARLPQRQLIADSIAHARARLPVERSVQWIPRKMGGSLPAIGPLYPIVIEQSALRDIRAHMVASSTEVAGLLVGQLCECPDTARLWVKASAAVPSGETLTEETGPEALDNAFEGLAGQIAEEGLHVVGWYHSHDLLGVFLSERDVTVQNLRFGEPWQFALVVIDGNRPAGGVFQRTEKGALPRTIYLPFQELLDAESLLPDERRRSYVDWGNYTTPTPRVVPVFALEGESDPGSDGAHPAPGVSKRNGEPPARPDSARWNAWIEQKKAEESDSADPLLTSHNVRVVLPGEPRDGDRRRKRRLVRRLVIATVAIAAGAGAWFVGSGALNAPGSDRPDPPTSAERPAPPTSVAGHPFPQALSGFERAVEGYGERRADFELGRIDCASLANGYRTVDDAFLALSESLTALQVGREQRQAEYERAAGLMDDVDGHFDGTGCARPG